VFRNDLVYVEDVEPGSELCPDAVHDGVARGELDSEPQRARVVAPYPQPRLMIGRERAPEHNGNQER
jgi:hypothetical protein